MEEGEDCRMALRLSGLQNRRPGVASAAGLFLDFYLGTQLNNPVGRDLELVRGAQRVTL